MASVYESMRTEPPEEPTASIRERVRDAWLVIFMAVGASSLRIALWTANEITLRYLYGWATVERDHLRIVKIKPLVVSNGMCCGESVATTTLLVSPYGFR